MHWLYWRVVDLLLWLGDLAESWRNFFHGTARDLADRDMPPTSELPRPDVSTQPFRPRLDD